MRKNLNANVLLNLSFTLHIWVTIWAWKNRWKEKCLHIVTRTPLTMLGANVDEYPYWKKTYELFKNKLTKVAKQVIGSWSIIGKIRSIEVVSSKPDKVMPQLVLDISAVSKLYSGLKKRKFLFRPFLSGNWLTIRS